MARLPGRAFLRASLALWRRRERYRKARHAYWQKRLDASRRRDQHPREQLVAKRDKWSKLLEQARANVALRKRQLDTPTKAKGIDVSNHQGSVDFTRVRAAGYTFVWLKATEGTTFTDAYFLANVRAAKAAGLKVGAYHFLNTAPAAAQARHFAAHVKAAGLGPGQLLPVADVEKTGVTTGLACSFIDAVHRELGVKPIVYTFPFFARWPSTFGCKLWIAHFGVRKPTIPGPWRRYTAWQHSSTANVPGVGGFCDVNKTSDLKELMW